MSYSKAWRSLRLARKHDPTDLAPKRSNLMDAPFWPPEDLVVDLPTPLSTNRTRRIDWRSMKSRAEWKKLADAMLLEQWRRLKGKEIKGRFEAIITLPHNYRADIDNSAKGVLDFLTTIKLIPDDSPKYLRRLTVELGDIPSGCRVILRGME